MTEPGNKPDESAEPGNKPDESAEPGNKPDESAEPGNKQDESAELAMALMTFEPAVLQAALATLKPAPLKAALRYALVLIDPEAADLRKALHARLGADWDPDSLTAQRMRAVRLGEAFWQYVHDTGASDANALRPILLKTGYFETIRAELAGNCDPRFGDLTSEQALASLWGRRGPDGAVGLIARWSVEVGAFDEKNVATAASHLSGAGRDARRRKDRKTKR